MDSESLYNSLNYVNNSRANRLHHAIILLENPSLIPHTIDILFMVDDPVSCRAALVLEIMCGENLDAFLPYLDQFSEKLHLVHLDSAVRPVAKICEYLTKAYFGKQPSAVKQKLTQIHKERIIEVCFDYMIEDEKIAPKAYSMNTLYLLGKEFDWIHPELANILERDFPQQSAGFKARARHILKKIKKQV